MCCFYVWFLSHHVFKDHPHWLWSNRNSWSPGPPCTDNSRWLSGIPVMTARGHCGPGKCSFHSSVANYRGLWGSYFSEGRLLKATYSCLLTCCHLLESVSQLAQGPSECCTKKAPSARVWKGTLVMYTPRDIKDQAFIGRCIHLVCIRDPAVIPSIGYPSTAALLQDTQSTVLGTVSPGVPERKVNLLIKVT